MHAAMVAEFKRVQLFLVALDGSNSDHFTSRSLGRLGVSGLGTTPLA